MKPDGYASARSVSRATAEIYRPSSRMLPSEAAVTYGLKDKEGKDWDAELSPYMVEPMNEIAGRRYTGIVFVSSARSAKTISLIHAGLLYNVTCAPGDSQIVQMTQDAAREFSLHETGPIMRNTAGFRDRLNKRRDKVFDKVFHNGVVVRYGWPSVSQLSSKTLRYIWITDYDRPDNRDNVDGEGPLWDLAMKRVQMAMSRGKCIAESSPGEDWVNAGWAPSHPHQAPPVKGLLSIYNSGTMARWFWPCQDCGHFMQAIPGPQQFSLPEFRELVELVKDEKAIRQLANQYAHVKCPVCAAMHYPQHRREMNLAAHWLHAGEEFKRNGKQVTITGSRIDTKIVSYWLGGAGAGFQTWDDMLEKYFQAVAAFGRNRDETKLRTSTNVDFGAPYMPRAAASRRKAEDLVKRAQFENWERGTVPPGVQYLIGAVDNQSYGFVASVYGIGKDNEKWLVERFEITTSKRLDGDRFARVVPETYDEDWDLLIDEVIKRKYSLPEAPELSMEVYYTHQDSGGQAGVTQRAYDFWRRLQSKGLGSRLRLVKGANSYDADRTKMTEGQTDDDEAALRGPVPLLMLNTTIFKDVMVGDLNRDTFGPGYLHIPRWIDPVVFAQYVSEVRGPQGYKRKPGEPNEQTDIHCYVSAAVAVIGGESIDWDNPPEWAKRPRRAEAVKAEPVAPAENFFASLGKKRAGR